MNVRITPFERAEFGTLVRKCGIEGKEAEKAKLLGGKHDRLPVLKDVGEDGIVIPVYGFQHGGPIVYKASKHGDPFGHLYYGFDSGLAGVVFVSGRRVKQLTTRKRKPYTVEQIEAKLIELVQEQSDFETDGAKYWFDCTVDELLEDDVEESEVECWACGGDGRDGYSESGYCEVCNGSGTTEG